MVRMSAEERRESVVRAAMVEFARNGYHGTSTEVIAKRVGVSQPYLFRLFPNKQAIFLAASGRCIDEIVAVFRDAAEGLQGEEALGAMGSAYQRLITEDRDKLLLQMQIYVTAAAAEAAGDHEFGKAARAGWTELYDTILLALGADAAGATTFLACGMLINTLVALGFPPEDRMWKGLSGLQGMCGG
ncbi:TetR/AcrR family transcriptional regulator [Streptomyces sp. NPDC006632]|uniref:TetR/AcrR family transcriptional regulator n=1 Tax=unclassified Streptomyces TaxID=2593676 RepID=UPI002E244134